MDTKTQEILKIFEQINAVPRCSKHEEKITQWMIAYAQKHNWATRLDPAGNLIIEVPATPGYEAAPHMVLQAHLDMVCEKDAASTHDFSKDPIHLVFDGDWLRANGTTLGADNGIGLAYALALAEDPQLGHPALELLFTVDEETGIGGANLLQPGFISGHLLINLDSEEEGIFTVGCAGGVIAHTGVPLAFSDLPQDLKIYRLEVSGAQGGHSGIDIARPRASANRLLIRLLHAALQQTGSLRLCCLQGGSAHNAIARQSWALVAVQADEVAQLEHSVAQFQHNARLEYGRSEPDLTVQARFEPQNGERGLSHRDTEKAIRVLMALPQGVARMSEDIPGFVETSNNVGKIELNAEGLHVVSSQRSSSATRLQEINGRIEAIAALAGGSVRYAGAYPAWQPDPDSPLLKRSLAIYEQLYGRQPVVQVIHAGLETSVIGEKYPGMQMISLGATIRDPHSPSERLYIPSVRQVWDFLVTLISSFKSGEAI